MQTLPTGLFNLEGTLLQFLGDRPHRPKSIVLEVEQEAMAIKLPKEVRATLDRQLKPGDRIRCIGRSQVNFKAGVIELKAYQVFSLPSSTETKPPHATLSVAAPKSAKILICSKSGCQKRGGQQMVAALKQMLREYQLQDQVEIQYTGCQKHCSKAPNLTIMPGKHRYDRVTLKSLSALIEEHFCSASRSVPDYVEG